MARLTPSSPNLTRTGIGPWKIKPAAKEEMTQHLVHALALKSFSPYFTSLFSVVNWNSALYEDFIEDLVMFRSSDAYKAKLCLFVQNLQIAATRRKGFHSSSTFLHSMR
jgi:hypothetical protein